MKKTLLTLLLGVLTLSGVSAQNPLLKRMADNMNAMSLQEKVNTKEMIKEFIEISDHGRYNDVMVLELYLAVNISDKDVEKYMSSLKADGSWPDINYNDKQRSQWGPSYHPTRIQSLAKVYKTPGSTYYMSPELSKVIHKAMDYWFKAGLVCPNWWYNEIGVPRLMGPAFILIRDELSSSELADAIKVMEKATLRQTGQNKIWQAGNVFIGALLKDDLALAKQARDSIVSEIYMSTAEGLQPDYSFHQHGPQMQFGNYGLAYAGTTVYWARIFSGTPWAISDSQLGYMRGYVLNGLQWTVWKGYMDPNACARQSFKNAQRGKGNSLAVTAVNMVKVDSEKASDYIRCVYRNQLNPSAANDVNGYRYFWRSDYGVFRTPSWLASVRMNSDRTIGYEMTNHENLKGVYSADGVMSIMLTGKEYDNIAPLWDWKRLPGLTAVYDTMPIPYTHPNKPVNKSGFVGGASDGKNGIAALDLSYDSLSARKSYFFIDDMVVCLGAGIKSVQSGKGDHNRVLTTVNQEWFKGGITYGTGVRIYPTNQTQKNIKWLSWAHHNNIGYCFINPSKNTEISIERRTGSWHDIASFYPADKIEEGYLFALSIDHGINPSKASYAYCVLPSRDAEQTKEFALKPGVKVESNTPQCQAVSAIDGSVTSAVFYTPSTFESKSFGGKIKAVTPGIVMLKKGDGDSYTLTVSDPTQKLSNFVVMLEGDFVGYNTSYDYKKGMSTIIVSLPAFKGEMGSSKTIVIRKLDHNDGWK